MPAAEQYTDPLAGHGEGPVWSPAWGGLAWVDMLAGDILRVDDAGAVQRWSVGPVAAAFRPRRGGGLVDRHRARVRAGRRVRRSRPGRRPPC